MADRDGVTLRLRVRWRLTPWWGRVLLVFAASRVVTTVIMLVFAEVQGAVNGTPAPDFFAFASIWDGQWYYQIALAGYPPTLPTDAAGHVTENAWAFLPVYPVLLSVFVRAGFPFALVAVLVSLLAGAGAALLFFRLLRELGFAAGAALFGVVLLCTSPLSPLFQVAYPEALALALLFLALLLVVRRRFVAVLPVIVLLSLTRPMGLAFALFLLLYLVHRIVRARAREAHPLPAREFVAVTAAGLTSVVAGLAWPAIAWAVTGSVTAYTDTELAWRAGYVGYGHLVPFQGWFQGLSFWLRFIGVPDAVAAPLGVVGGIVLPLAFLGFLLTPWARALGRLRLWLVAYLVYLLAVFFPQSSTWRLLLPLAPVLGAFAVPRSRLLRAGFVAVGLVLQLLWVQGMWMRGPGDWSPP